MMALQNLRWLRCFTLKYLASKVGIFVHSKGMSNDFMGNFYCVKVMLDVRKPPKSIVSLVRAGKRE
jgi:hypothetical protein